MWQSAPVCRAVKMSRCNHPCSGALGKRAYIFDAALEPEAGIAFARRSLSASSG